MTQTFVNYVACMSTHTFGIEPDSEAEKHFHGKNLLGPGECPVCNDDRRESLKRSARLCECIDDVCADGCAYVLDIEDIQDPPDHLIFIGDD